ncbi:Myosin-8 [Symbiodinium microadriaticum]|uniref:Myosin-8 n=1 Tax=Symbiodinium microadriaticum TaxID=2951 RepID=A0A1Q9CIZ1_SYMMI|nr:Myosin-8 [Symbiodinium microadriaticum]
MVPRRDEMFLRGEGCDQAEGPSLMPAPPKRPEEEDSSLPSPQPVPNRVPAGPGKLSRNKAAAGRLMPSLPEDQELHPPSPMQSGECFRLRHVRVEALLQDGTLGLLLHGTSVVGFCSEEAASHGWFVGDQIVEINGKRVAAFDEFLEQFLAAQVQGFPIVFSVLRREAPEETPDEDPLESFFSEIDFVDLAGRLKKKFGGSPGKAELASTGSSGDAILENPYIQALRRRRTELSKSPEGWSEESQSLAAKMATERGDALATLSRASTDTPRRFERRAGLLDWSLCIMRPCHEKEVVDELRTTPRMDYDYAQAPKWLAKNKVAMPNAVVLSRARRAFQEWAAVAVTGPVGCFWFALKGTLIWIKHEEEVWIQAEIVTANEKEIIVKTAEDPNSRIVLGPHEPIFLRTSDVFTSEGLSVLDDLCQLTHLHEPAVLSSLQNRFDIDKIYTFTGPILIALNPFKGIPGLYDEEAKLQLALRCGRTRRVRREVLKSFMTTKPSSKPHVFNTSNATYRGICDRRKSQTVLISGESGAGKTETTKFVMKFLAMAGAADGEVTSAARPRDQRGGSAMRQVEKQVLESNPLLEAFGNARTLRNDNSSRFGKLQPSVIVLSLSRPGLPSAFSTRFIELQFRSSGQDASALGVAGENCRLCGARIQTYLLEKVRVCDQQEGERNYHLFYEACAAASLAAADGYAFPQRLAKEKVKEVVTLNLEDVDDVEMFERRIHAKSSESFGAMQTIGIPHEEVAQILRMVASAPWRRFGAGQQRQVLHLGNVKFDAPSNNSEGSMAMAECDRSVAPRRVVAGRNGEQASGSGSESLGVRGLATRFLHVRESENEVHKVRSALCSQTRVTRSEKIRSPVNVRQAADNRDALAKAVYGIVFNFIVQSTNMSIGYVEDVKLFAGVLDIFGLRLCINFTNERLQQFFNSFVFKLEEQLYEREGIEWDPLDFPDNQDAVDMLQAKAQRWKVPEISSSAAFFFPSTQQGTGVFAILDEECAGGLGAVVPQGSDQGFNNKLIKQHRGHRRFDEIKTKPSWHLDRFVIKHFAGPVSYCSDGFLDKNKDQLSNDLIECMGASTNEFIVRTATLQIPKESYAKISRLQSDVLGDLTFADHG